MNRPWTRSRTLRPLPGQRSFAELAPDPGWATSRPSTPRVQAPQLLPTVRAQARRFETAMVEQGLARANSARTYRKALECLCKQAQRHLGRSLADIAEIYDIELIAAVAVDDEPFDGSTYQLSRYTLRQRRVVLTAYLRAIGLPGITFEAGQELIKLGLRRASDRRGYRYVIPAGRQELRDRYRPPLADVRRFLAAALGGGNAYAGARLAAAALTLWHGLRPVSLLRIDGSDFSERRGSLFLTYTEKAARNKRARREIEIRAPPPLSSRGTYQASIRTRPASAHPIESASVCPALSSAGCPVAAGDTARSSMPTLAAAMPQG